MVKLRPELPFTLRALKEYDIKTREYINLGCKVPNLIVHILDFQGEFEV